jgi:hypothetical protein
VEVKGVEIFVTFSRVLFWKPGFLSNFDNGILDEIEKKLILKNHEDFVIAPRWEKYAAEEKSLCYVESFLRSTGFRMI